MQAQPGPRDPRAAAEHAPARDADDVTMEATEPHDLDAILARHTSLSDRFASELERCERQGVRLSWLRLGTFLAAVVILASAWAERSLGLLAWGALALLGFFAAVVAHGRTIAAQETAMQRREVHLRHAARVGLGWTRFASKGETLVTRDHAYAWDIDLVGQGSLFQRIDVTHTHLGERTLAAWLAAAARTDTALARQVAVMELRDRLDFRRELEVAAFGPKDEKLDASRLDTLPQLPSLFAQRAWLTPIMWLLPAATLGLIALGSMGVVRGSLWVLPAIVQSLLLMRLGKEARNTLDVVGAKAKILEAYQRMLVVVEAERWQSPLLQSLQARLQVAGKPPSVQLKRLAFWVGFAELRYNLLHPVINGLTLWDLHVVRGIERFVREVGPRLSDWFLALGELEALASLATLAELDPSAHMPELCDERLPLTAAGLAHPLLPAGSRVANDLHLRGPGTALVVTGSNMAGKSTLLRSVGQNIALALAGGPVIAHSMRVPRVRLRASMRADDSLEAGSSYFHAELSKLKRVIEHAQESPPVFFLLDELLRGTNARARHVGAKAVLLHLLARDGTGLCATHDVELAALGTTDMQHIENVHFTDVMLGGEMCFDYRLRPGIVRTSNALRLLAMAGIEVPQAERDALEGPNARLEQHAQPSEAPE